MLYTKLLTGLSIVVAVQIGYLQNTTDDVIVGARSIGGAL
jgi:hypothetical protein